MINVFYISNILIFKVAMQLCLYNSTPGKQLIHLAYIQLDRDLSPTACVVLHDRISHFCVIFVLMYRIYLAIQQ